MLKIEKYFKSIKIYYYKPMINQLKMAITCEKLEKVKDFGRKWVRENILANDITRTKPGSIKYLLFGEKPSEQSISIKFGTLGERIAKEMIASNPELELLVCGVQVIDEKNKKKKDIDLIWANHAMRKIYIREAKGNIELDTEKLPATFKKITDDLLPFVKEKYIDYEIDVGILNWSVYTRSELSNGLNHIKKCETNGVQVDHWFDFCKVVGFTWAMDDYYGYMRELGKMITENMDF